MLVVIARAEVKPENQDKFIAIAKELVTKTREEPGNVTYALLQGMEENLMTFAERWKDKAALEAHFDMEYFKRILPQLSELQEGPTKLDVYTVAV